MFLNMVFKAVEAFAKFGQKTKYEIDTEHFDRIDRAVIIFILACVLFIIVIG